MTKIVTKYESDDKTVSYTQKLDNILAYAEIGMYAGWILLDILTSVLN
jgi:hypothetical protein